MYVILVYDLNIKRITTILKICRMYLHHVQNSVFEGTLSLKNYQELKGRLSKIIDKDEDSIIIYNLRKKELFKKEIIGVEKNPAENIL